jgi:hypothetical protein
LFEWRYDLREALTDDLEDSTFLGNNQQAHFVEPMPGDCVRRETAHRSAETIGTRTILK